QAIETGTPAAIDGRQDVASFFNGAAHAALPVGIDGRAGSAWYDRGTARVLFDLTVVDGLVTRIDFRADPAVLARVVRRKRSEEHTSELQSRFDLVRRLLPEKIHNK